MIKFILVRVCQALLTLLAASFVVFALARVTGSPADTMLPMDATPAEREAMITRLGLDLPLAQQYWIYVKDAARGRPPFFSEEGSRTYPLGTDRQGRDILSRIIAGTRISLSVAVLSILVGGGVGTALGLLAGHRGGWVDALIMRTVDLTLAFPSILLALIFAVTVGASFWVVVAVLGFILWARYARLVRGEVLAWKQLDFVALARMAGCSSLRIILSHLLPNVVNSVVVLSTLQIGWAIVVEASLSFLGAGIPPPAPTWGGMVAEGRKYVDTLWWVSACLGVAIMLVVLSFNMVGDWLRDVLDPKLRQL